MFIKFAQDLKALDILNYLVEYADDTSLLSPQNNLLLLSNCKWRVSSTGQEKTKCHEPAEDRGTRFSWAERLR